MKIDKMIRFVKWVNKRYPPNAQYASDKAVYILSLLIQRENKDVFARLRKGLQ